MFGCLSECFSGCHDDTDDDDLNLDPVHGSPNISSPTPAAVAATRTSFSSYHSATELQLPSTNITSSDRSGFRDSIGTISAVKLKPSEPTRAPADIFRSSSSSSSSDSPLFPSSPPSPHKTGTDPVASRFHEKNRPISNEAGIGSSRFTPAYIEPANHLRQPDAWNAQLGSGSATLQRLRQAYLTQTRVDSSCPGKVQHGFGSASTERLRQAYFKQAREEDLEPDVSTYSPKVLHEDSPASHSSQSSDLQDSTPLSVQSSQSQDLADLTPPSSHSSHSQDLSDKTSVQPGKAIPETFEEAAANLRNLTSFFDAQNNSEEMQRSMSSVVPYPTPYNASTIGDQPTRAPVRRRRPVRECVVCSEVSSRQHPFPTQKIASTCTHKSMTCKACLRAWILAQLDSSTWDHIACPECDELMQHGDVRLHAATADFRRYDNLSLSSYLSSEEGFFRCLAPRCGAGQIHPSGAAEPIFRCGSCQTRSCIVCNILWHEDRTCAEYQEELENANRTSGERQRHLALIKTQEEASAATLEGISKTCPRVGCGARIQKNGGCDHMTCSKCKYDFCWLCFADYNEIRRIGNEAHVITCRWFDPEAGDMHEADEGEDEEDEEDDQNEADDDENEGDGNDDDEGNDNNEGNDNENNDHNATETTFDTDTDTNSMTVEFTQGPRNTTTRPLAQPGRYWSNLRHQPSDAQTVEELNLRREHALQTSAWPMSLDEFRTMRNWTREVVVRFDERVRQRRRARREQERGQQVREAARLQREVAERDRDRRQDANSRNEAGVCGETGAQGRGVADGVVMWDAERMARNGTTPGIYDPAYNLELRTRGANF